MTKIESKENRESWGVKSYYELKHPRLEKRQRFKVVKLGKARAWLNSTAAFVGWGQPIGRESAASIKGQYICPHYHLVSRAEWFNAIAKLGAVVIEDGFYRPHRHPVINVRAGRFDTSGI